MKELFMIIKKPQDLPQPNRPILSFLIDVPNICSLTGLACTLVAIYFLMTGVYVAAMIGMIWAVAFDWADGLIARSMKGRTSVEQQFGAQLDLIIDLVSYAITPAILLLSYTNFNPYCLLVAFIMLVFGAIRLSYFSIFGLSQDGKYTGLAIDNNSIFLVFLFMLENQFDHFSFSMILVFACFILAVLNVSQIRTPKLSGNPINVAFLAVFTIGTTIFYGLTLTYSNP